MLWGMCTDGTRLTDIGLVVKVMQSFVESYRASAPDMMIFPPGDYAQAPDLNCMSCTASPLFSRSRFHAFSVLLNMTYCSAAGAGITVEGPSSCIEGQKIVGYESRLKNSFAIKCATVEHLESSQWFGEDGMSLFTARGVASREPELTFVVCPKIPKWNTDA